MPLTVKFASKKPHHTAWLEFQGTAAEFAEAEKPGGVIADLLALGWKKSPIPPAPPLADGIIDYDYVKNGSDIFNSWTPAEKTANFAAAREVLKKHRYNKVPWHKRTLEEML